MRRNPSDPQQPSSQPPLLETLEASSKSLPVTAIEKAKDEALTVLRSETALSRFPLHRIAKKSGDIAIEIHNQAAAVEWNVSHNTKYGQPGPLAYRIDTLLVNRRIEEAGKPVPRLIRLGTLPEIAQELGFTGHNWNLLRRAIHQNASAYITAKISYRAADRSERLLEAGFNRYNVIFTGEKLPSGEAASAVYLVLSDIFLDVLNTSLWRPLDYDYMKALPPGSQRFYEIVSYQIYAALLYKNPRAKLAYSEYCLLSTATRYLDFEHVKKQMYKIVRPHLQSGYLAKVEYEATVDQSNKPDWIIYLTPGVNASREYRAFTGQGQTQTPKKKASQKAARAAAEALILPLLPFPEVPVPEMPTPSAIAPPTTPLQTPTTTPSATISNTPTVETSGLDADDSGRGETQHTEALVEALVAADLNRGDAERFARERPEVCRRQLEYLAHVKEFKISRGAYLRRAIEGDFGAPAAYAQQQARQVAAQEAKRRRARELAEANQEKARQSHEERFSGAYREYLRQRREEAQTAHSEAFAGLLEWEQEQRAVYLKPLFADRPMNKKALEVFDREESHLERFRDHFRKHGLWVPDFWQWDEKINPQAFRD